MTNIFYPDTIQHHPSSSRDRYGQPVPAPAVSYPARIVFKTARIKQQSGDFVTAAGTAWIEGQPTIATDDEVTLPDDSKARVVEVQRFPDALLPHVKVRFQ